MVGRHSAAKTVHEYSCWLIRLFAGQAFISQTRCFMRSDLIDENRRDRETLGFESQGLPAEVSMIQPDYE